MEIEGVEQQIYLQPEMAIVGAVYSVNGYTGHVVLTTSDLENTSDYQTSTDVASLISAHNTSEEAHPYIQALISSKQDPIVAGNGISITGGNTIAIDTTVVATQQNLATEVTNRENADIALQGQIDAISASSDVVDIIGTYAELQSYDTSKLKDNDIIKVLQDSTQGNATTYYRWSKTTETFTLIGQEGPYYTKASADAQFVPQTRTINSKPLSANITLTASDVSALGQSDIVQTTGTSTSQVMSQNAVTTALATKLDSADVPSGFFDGPATTTETPATSVELNNVLKLSELELLGDTAQDTTTGKNLINLPNYKQTENGIEWTVSDTNHAVGNGTTSSNAGSYLCYTQNMNLDITGDFTFSISKAITAPIYLRFYNDSNTNLGQLSINTGATSKTGTIPTGATKYRVLLAPAPNTYYDIDIYLQLERGSSPTSIEPYTGGAPSPNPDYPQTVEVVTGEQTISVSDGTNSTDYTIELGSIELCKIGEYQDYIYQGSDGWYIHKTINKVLLNGSESWTMYSGKNGTFYIAKSDIILATSIDVTPNVISDYYEPKPFRSLYDMTVDYGVANHNGQHWIAIRNKDCSDSNSFKTWLASNNTTVYYVLATPTDTKITDSTLAGQLDALLSAQLYPEYTVISSTGNLPAILGITAYNSNLNGIIEVLASTASTLGNVNSALNIINNGGN